VKLTINYTYIRLVYKSLSISGKSLNFKVALTIINKVTPYYLKTILSAQNISSLNVTLDDQNN